MPGSFDYFVVFAEMRTGSNFLETNLNAFASIQCLGEAFNPHFIGYPNKTELLGKTLADREENPARLLDAIRSVDPGIAGFRFFHDHDPRVLQTVLDDPRCAKIILTRNPLDSYVSWKIAQATGQWKLTDVKSRKDAKAQFEPDEYARHVEALQDFQVLLLKHLQHSGQTAFYLAYDDLQDIAAMNGLARWLGVSEELQALDKSLKPQNPKPVISKVANPDEMRTSLSDLDRFNLSRTPNFEPRRGPAVPTYVAGARTPLLYLPIKGGLDTEVADWLAALDGVSPDQLLTRANQKQLRQWKRTHPGHRSFTILRHPLDRAHSVFCRRILSTAPDAFEHIRETLIKRYKLPLPKGQPDGSYDRAAHRAAFEGFLNFARANLAGQTSVRTDAAWATQTQALAGFAELMTPDYVIREADMPGELSGLAQRLGGADIPAPTPEADPAPFTLSDIYDPALEDLVTDVYQRDYLMFGFQSWADAQAA